MRIDDLNRASVTQSTEQSVAIGQQQNQAKEPLNQDAVAGSDQAEVSNLAQSLASADSGRIEQLRLDVQSGNYNVSAGTVANALIESHLKQ
jgi:anti-sigma28 factor (negative regulator of flagellin synthesis)